MTGQLIGREPELDALRSAVAGAAEGSPAAVVLSGLPGVGKSRLAREALDLAAASGFTVFSGRAQEFTWDVAYAPLVAAFGPSVRDLDPDRRAALVGDLPQLGLIFAGLGLDAPAPLGEPALERARLLDGFSLLIDRMARENPLALLVDDVQFADESTLAFLHYLINVVTDRPVLLVLTARLDEPGDERLVSLVREVANSIWTSTQIAVEPFSDADAAALIGDILGSPAEARLCAMICDRCGGRPLFIEAVCRTLAEDDRVRAADGVARLGVTDLPLPDVVRDQLRIRLAGLSGDERRVVDILAVADAGLDYASLTTVVDFPADRMVAALERLHGRGLLGGGSAMTPYELVHSLLRDTLLAELSPTGTAHLHAQLAQVLIAQDPEDAAIAEHILQAGALIEPGRAAEYLVRGARHDMSLGASATAIRYFRAGIDAAAKLGRSEQLASLHDELAAALLRSADGSGAAEAWSHALSEYRELGDAAAAAGVEQQLGMLAWSGGDLDGARAHFSAAEHELEGLDPSPAHARLLFGKVVVASRIGDSATVERAAREVRALASALGSPALTAQALLSEAVVDYVATDYTGMADTSRAALSEAQNAGDRMLELRAHDQMSVAHASQLDIAELRRSSHDSLSIADGLGAPVLGGWPRCRLAIADLLGGDWDAALQNSTEMCEITRRFDVRRGSVSALSTHAWVLARRGSLVEAERYLDEARARAKPMLEADRNVFTITAIAGTVAALARSNFDEAARIADRLGDTSGGWMPMLGLTLLGEALARSGDPAGAALIAERLGAVRSCNTVAPAALAHWVRAVVAGQTGMTQVAIEHFDAAADAFAELGLPFHTARSQLGAACVLANSDPQGAIDRGNLALTAFDLLGAPLEAKAARDLLRGLGVVPSRGRSRVSAGSPLSPRELEVARLVAAGMTNAEVATTLFVSPRTVTTHLDRIYARMKLSSRVALTRYLADSGLLADNADG